MSSRMARSAWANTVMSLKSFGVRDVPVGYSEKKLAWVCSEFTGSNSVRFTR